MRLFDYLNENLDDLRLDYIERDCQPYLRDLRSASPVDGLLLSGRKKREAMFQGRVRKDRRPKDTPLEIQELVDDMFDEEFGVRPRSNSMFTISRKDIAEDYGEPFFIFPIGRYEIIWSKNVEDFYGDIVDSDIMNPQLIIDNEIPEWMWDEYEWKYGEDRAGYWEYRGEDWGVGKDVAIEDILEYYNDIESLSEDEIDNLKNDIEQELTWVPEKTEEEFMQEVEDEKQNDLRRVRDVISDYEEGNLKEALQWKHEIMLICDGYYAVNYNSYRAEVLEWLKNMGIDVRAYGRR